MATREQRNVREAAARHLAEGRRLSSIGQHRQAIAPLGDCCNAFELALASSRWDSDARELRLASAGACSLLAYALGRCWDLDAALTEADRAVLALTLLDAAQLGDPGRLAIAEALDTRGEILTRLEYLAEAEACHDRALALLRPEHTPIDALPEGLRYEAARALVGRGNALADRGDAVAAVADYQPVVDYYAANAAAVVDEVSLRHAVLAARAATNLANTRVELGQMPAADALHAQAVASYRRLVAQQPPCSPLLGHALRCHARARFLAGDLDQAMALADEAVTIFERLCDLPSPGVSDDDPIGGLHFVIDLVKAMAERGRAATRAGRADESSRMHAEAQRRLERLPARFRISQGVPALLDVELGNALADQGLLPEAQQHYEAAVATYLRLVDAGRTQYRAGLARARTNLGNALAAGGAFTQARPYFKSALEDYDWLNDLAPGQTHLLAARAHTRLCLANAEYRLGLVHEAGDRCRLTVLDCRTLLAGAPLAPLAAMRARAEALLARTQIGLGKTAEAMQHGRAAQRMFASLPGSATQPHLMTEAAAATVVLGNALSERGEYQLAERCYVDAKALLERVQRSHPQVQIELARIETNLGNAYRRMGQFEKALVPLHLAVDQLKALAARQPRYLGNLGHSILCLGAAQAPSGFPELAKRSYEAAIDCFETLVATQPQHQPDLARALARLGSIELSGQEFKRAHEHLSEAVRHFAALPHRNIALAVEQAHAQVDLALACLELRLAPQASALFEQTWLGCVEQADNGNVAMSGPGLRVLAELLPLCWRGRKLYLRLQRDAPAELAHPDAIITRIDAFADDYLDRRDGQLRTIDRFIELLAAASASGPNRIPTADFDRIFAICLRWTAVLARDADPAWLVESATHARLGTLIRKLQVLTIDRGPSAVAWFLHSFALRSSRQLLAASADPTLRALYELLDRYDRVSRELLGKAEAREGYRSDDDLDPQIDLDEQLFVLEREIRNKRRAASASPQAAFSPVPTMADVETRIAAVQGTERRREALMLLCAGPDGHEKPSVWIMVLRSPSGERRRVQIDRGTSAPRETDAAGSSSTGGAAELASAGLARIIEALVDLAADDVQRVSIVPSPQLCSQPWHLLLAEADTTRGGIPEVRVYPSVWAWWQVRDRAATDARAASGRIALVCYDAYRAQGVQWLPFAEAEVLLAESILDRPGPTVQRLSSAELLEPGPGPRMPDADALIAIGHGKPARDDNWVGSGVLIAGDMAAPVLMTGPQVREIGRVRHIFVNTCLLGETRTFLGEALGMFSEVFEQGFHTRTAIGIAGLVDDFDALLISLAFLFALKQGRRGWLETFVDVQRELCAGQWPDGFAPWLREQLADALLDDRCWPRGRRLEAYARLRGGDLQDGVFPKLGLAPMAVDRPLTQDWRPELLRLADAVADCVPTGLRQQARNYVAFGD